MAPVWRRILPPGLKPVLIFVPIRGPERPLFYAVADIYRRQCREFPQGEPSNSYYFVLLRDFAGLLHRDSAVEYIQEQ